MKSGKSSLEQISRVYGNQVISLLNYARSYVYSPNGFVFGLGLCSNAWYHYHELQETVCGHIFVIDSLTDKLRYCN